VAECGHGGRDVICLTTFADFLETLFVFFWQVSCLFVHIF
jgi:hypothetical protein